jgi:hypothetical protein
MALVSEQALLGKVGDAMMPRIRKPRPPKRYPKRAWSTQDDTYLTSHYHVKPVRLIARALKRTVHSVFARATKLGITYAGHRVALTPTQVEAMLGISKPTLQRRLTSKAVSTIPHHRVGRYIEIYENELYDWLSKGNVLGFDRAKIDPAFHRMYDAWRGRVITTAEINAECAPLMDQRSQTRINAPDIVCMMPGHVNALMKGDVYAWAYQWGHLIPPWASPRFKVVKAAWDTEWMHKCEIYEHMSYTEFSRKVKPYITRETHTTIHRGELCARLAELGWHDLAKRWQSVPIPWQELMRDYERKAKR